MMIGLSMNEKIIEKIMEKSHCTKAEANDLFADLKLIDSKLKPVFEAWINDKPFKDISVGDFSIKSLMSDYDMEFTGALLTLDWLCKDPDMAVKALRHGIK